MTKDCHAYVHLFISTQQLWNVNKTLIEDFFFVYLFYVCDTQASNIEDRRREHNTVEGIHVILESTTNIVLFGNTALCKVYFICINCWTNDLLLHLDQRKL